jgi:dUTP pyrophosphatase
MLEVNIKKLKDDAVIPSYAKYGDAGMDLTAVSVNITEDYIEYGTGLALEIPDGYVGLMFPRSSVTSKDLMMKNCVGVIDSQYRGEMKARFNSFGDNIYQVGERVAQLIIMPYPQITFKEVNELSSTERGEDGFGSTNK